jgi:hypothetical protein
MRHFRRAVYSRYEVAMKTATMPSPTYVKFLDAITKNRAASDSGPFTAIKAHYTKDDSGVSRKLLPYAIGTTPDQVTTNPGVEMVLCCQYDDGLSSGDSQVVTPHPNIKKNFRCFTLASLINSDENNPVPEEINFVAKDPPNWKPKRLKAKKFAKQNCIETVDLTCFVDAP